MANFSKSFNFRNGLQVDDDKLIVKPNTGLVGIGSTIPTEVLDVKGNIKSSGIVTSPNIVAGTGITVGTGVNQISLDGTTGFITAKNYFGDGSTLTNIVAIATAGFKELSGTLSTSFSVGIGSLNTGSGGVFPDFTLDVLGDMRVTGPSTFIGITTVSDLFADRFSVSNSTSIGGGATIDQANITGVSTFGGNIDILDDVFLNIGSSDDLRLYHLASGESVIAEFGTGNLNILANFTKIGTIAGGVKFETLTTGAKVTGNLQVTENTDLDGTLNVDSTSTFDGISVTGVSSFTNTTNSVSPTSGAVIISGGVGISKRVNLASDVTVGGILYVQGTGSQILVDSGSFIDCNGNLDVDGHTELDNVNIAGVVTATTVDSNQLKLLHNGTQVLNTIGAGVSVSNTLSVISLNGGASGLSSSSGSLRYGNDGGNAPYSTRRSLDLINNDSGNINFYLNANNLSVPVDGSNFIWHKGFNNDRLMTLTNTGNLGIGKTDPNTALHVEGISTVTGNSFVAGNFYGKQNLEIGGDANVTGDLSANSLSLSSSLNSNLVGDVTGNLFGNVIATSGISTFDSLAIGTLYPAGGIELDASQVRGAFLAVGIGTTQPESAVDFANAGQSVGDRFMIPPTITTTERDSISEPINGGLIFNSTANRLEVYIGGWVGIATTT